MTLAERLLAYSRTLGMAEPRCDGTVCLSMLLAADMAGAMREASGRLEGLEMERDAAQRAQATAGDDGSVQPFMACPHCSAEYPDFDGFGVLYCPRCGFCAHASRALGPEGWVCGFCGDVMPRDEEVTR